MTKPALSDSDKAHENQIPGLMTAEDGSVYCAWHAAMPEYHGSEWGRPVADDIRLFEKICLEGFQSGLAWITILRKRDNFRAAFDGFDFHKVARYQEADIARLLGDAGIIRNRAKIASAINNARRAIELVAEAGSLAAWFWQFEPSAKERPRQLTLEYWQVNPTSPASVALSKELKKRGWSFVGPTTIYAFMQAMGLVNDHLSGCACRATVEAERKAFQRPRLQ